MKLLICIALFCVLFSRVSSADTIHLKNGNQISGVVVEDTASTVVIRLKSGKATVSKSQIQSIERDAPATQESPRIAPWQACLAEATRTSWGSEIAQIPATVIDKGVMRSVPYLSYRAGNYEVNVYGDPDDPAGIEIGIYKDLLESQEAKNNCLKFIDALLGQPRDKSALKSLSPDQDSKEVDGLTLEITPPTAEDAYEGWWVSIYDQTALDRARASAEELAAITVRMNDAEKSKIDTAANSRPARMAAASQPITINKYDDAWTANEMTYARRPSGGVSPATGGSVYVRDYTRKDGTYVHSHTRAAPGFGRGSHGSGHR